MPIPGGSDRHLLIVQRGSCKLFELFAARKTSNGWRAGSAPASTSNSFLPSASSQRALSPSTSRTTRPTFWWASLAATPVSFNLTGGIYMNQNAAFSDFHVTGGNPAGNASFTNPEYVTKRFTWVGHREPVKV